MSATSISEVKVSAQKENRPSLALVSLGCAKNAADLEVIAGNMVKEGWVFSPDPNSADTVIINTCAFIASAREEAESEIRRALSLKKKGAFSRVVVTGCYPQRYPEAVSKFPGVDEWRGVPKKWVEPHLPALRFTGKAFAYLKIAEGCNHRCTYCAIPSIRGKYRSRPIESILREAQALIQTGCREINIVAQDPMLWKNSGYRLVDLLEAIDSIKGDFWVRVLYSYPSEIDSAFLDWMVSSPHAVRYVDMPVQHTVAEVLEKMNRASTIDAAVLLPDIVRSLVPGVTLRTTVLTGFPGETPLRFKKLLSDLRRLQFDHLGAFAYSPEKGTKGAEMSSRPSRQEALERERLVMEQQKAIWECRSKKMVGSKFKALVVAPGVARMESQAPDVDGVTFVKDALAEDVGSFIDVKIVRRKGFDFVGERVVRGK
jgi:ribosomal protein S12 methylthiotransferase